MSNVIVDMGMSLDGFVAGPNGNRVQLWEPRLGEFEEPNTGS